jgi:hypothetical protein
MTILNPAIWDNETLGEAGLQEFLDVITAQEWENIRAEREDRDPRTVIPKQKFPLVPPQEGNSYNRVDWEFEEEEPEE